GWQWTMMSSERNVNGHSPLASYKPHFGPLANLVYTIKVLCLFALKRMSVMATGHKNAGDIPTVENSKQALRKLSESGMKKINFAGGEPFLYPKYLADLMDFCKNELKLESVSIVSNGSKIKRTWLQKNRDNLDILAISCDSFNEETNIQIGRGVGQHTKNLYEISNWCHQLGIKFKLNTVVNSFNWEEDMNKQIEILAPFRWKCFQVLIIENENGGLEGTLRDARRFKISKEEFESFVEKHKNQKSLVKESNDIMKNSYLILDEKLRFLNCTHNNKVPSESLLDVDVDTALQQAGWDENAFFQRQGMYDWSKFPTSCTEVNNLKNLDW
ncbi:3195_t:CDS:2, partial [Cetraspora pellucida]